MAAAIAIPLGVLAAVAPTPFGEEHLQVAAALAAAACSSAGSYRRSRLGERGLVEHAAHGARADLAEAAGIVVVGAEDGLLVSEQLIPEVGAQRRHGKTAALVV